MLVLMKRNSLVILLLNRLYRHNICYFLHTVFTCMTLHMKRQGKLRRKSFLTVITRIKTFASVNYFSVNIQSAFPSKSFATSSTRKRLKFSVVCSFVKNRMFSLYKPFITQMRPWLVTTWTFRDTAAVSRNLHLKRARLISAVCLSLYSILCTSTTQHISVLSILSADATFKKSVQYFTR